MSYPVASLLISQFYFMDVIHSLHDIFPDQMSCFRFNRRQVFLKDVARLIHEAITELLLVANTEAFPKVINQTPSNEIGYVDGNSDFRSLCLGIAVGHGRVGDKEGL